MMGTFPSTVGVRLEPMIAGLRGRHVTFLTGGCRTAGYSSGISRFVATSMISRDSLRATGLTVAIGGLVEAPAGGVYRCEQGGTITYQAEPCARGSVQSDVSRGSVSVFDGRAQTDQLARLQALRQPPDPRQETAFGEIAAPPPVISSARCQALIEAIERVDEQGRRPNKPQTLEWLRKTRRELVDETYMLKCSRIPQR